MTPAPQITYSRGRYKYRLEEPYEIGTTILGASAETTYLDLNRSGRLYIRRHYCWDGPSGPTWDTVTTLRPSLIHDALYQLIRLGLIDKRHKPAADRLFHDLLLENGMNRIRAWLWWRAVARCGGAAAAPGSERPILRAP